jgi:hypothetical protein
MLVVVAAAGCGDKRKKAFEALKPKAVESISAIESVGKKPLPDLTADDLSSPEPLIEVGLAGANNVVLSDKAAAELPGKSDDPFDAPYQIGDALRWTRSGSPTFWPSQTEQEITGKMNALTSIKYVTVVKIVEHKKPVIGALLTPGVMRGEAHVFSLAGKSLGGVRFQGTNSDKVSFTKKIDKATGKEVSSNKEDAVEDDLEKNAKKALAAAVKAKVPGSGFFLY